MIHRSSNPFEVTKAVDFTDLEIEANWVDLPGGGFASLADPRSPMPRFITGGKGGGRTHLLRHFSFALQRLRHQERLSEGIQEDGYVGIYFRCGGLNSSRFAGKRQDPDTWAAVFSFYTEIWLGRLAIEVIASICSSKLTHDEPEAVSSFAQKVRGLFDVNIPSPSFESHDPLRDLTVTLCEVQRRLDVAINNAALTHKLDIDIVVSPGRLVFGIPAAASEVLPGFSSLVFAYLLDEYENLTVDQQRYVNTLIREKQLPTSFLVGSRRNGLRTHITLSAGEENKKGSEYDLVVLEDTYRSKTHKYTAFCADIVRKRLLESNCDLGLKNTLSGFFETPGDIQPTIEGRARALTQERLNSDLAPWLTRAEKYLRDAGKSELWSEVLLNLRYAQSPLHEKFALLLFYRAWANNERLDHAAKECRLRIDRLLNGKDKTGKLATTYKHYRHDLYSQIRNDFGEPQEYFGIEDFVRMSGYLPRNLLVVLKQVTRWSLFMGEQPFRGSRISLKAQAEGVREASAWFLSDAKGMGRIGESTQLAIRRLASLFRDMRFSEKPVEVSCSAFSTSGQGLSAAASHTLAEAIGHSLILEVPNGRRDKNSQVLHHKYQLNPMLAPNFDLSLALRGSANFSSDELNAIFDPDVTESAFNSVRRRLLSRIRPPFESSTAQSTFLV
jgi:hypothetical protein